MDRTTVFTKTAKGLMEATGKTSHLSRDIRAVLKEVDGRATVELLQTRLGKLSEAKLQEALETLTKGDYVREFSTAASSVAPTAARTAPPPPRTPVASGDEDLDFTSAMPSSPSVDKKAEEAAKQKARAAAAAAEAAARAKAAAEAAARAKAEAEAKAKAEAAARAKAEAEAKARAEAAARAKAEAEARAKAEAEARAKREAEERARKEAEEKARREADELRAKLEEERKAREEAERKAKEEAERQRREAEEKARREADELRAKLEEERKAREEAERKAKEEAERQRREAEEKARREADELRAKLEEERKAREEAERKAKEEAERRAREDAERKAKDEAERARREAEDKATREAEEQARRQAEERARIEAEARAREEAERKAREEAERTRLEAEERTKRETEERARREAEEQARRQAEQRAQAEENARVEAEAAERRKRAEAEERASQEAQTQARKAAEEAERKAKEEAERVRRETEGQAVAQPPLPADSSLEDLVKIETDFDAVLKSSVGAPQEAAKRPARPDDLLQKAAEELERRQAEEQARAAEEKARAQAQAEAEAKAKRAEEEGPRKGEAQERKKAAPVGAEEHLSSQAEAQALLEAQNAETERHFADMEKELDAEQAAAPARIETPEPSPARTKKESKQSARAAAAAAAQAREADLEFEPTPEPYRPRTNWGKPVALGLFLLLVLGLVLVNFISFDSSIPQFEKLAGAYLQQPVKIKSLHLSLVPRPHWRMDGVSVGNEGQLKVARVNAVAELGSMFSDKKAFSSIELESPVLSEQGLLGLLFGKPAGRDFKVASVVAKNAKLESKTFILPALDAKIALGEGGAWQKIALETPDHKTSLTLKPDGEGAALEVETNAFSLPFHPSFILENFVASGQIRRGELRLKEFKGGIYDGYLSGNASLKWDADWSLNGEVSVRAMDPGRFVPALLEQGKLEGKATYSMRAKSYDELYEAPRLEGTFDILKGNLLGVDLGRMLQGGGAGGKTAYAELTGGFVREAGRTQLRQLNLVSGPVSAGGSAEVDGVKRISGRFAVELKSPVAHARVNLTLSGTLQEPHFSR